mgnify:CR=1 FL=1
MSKIEVNAIEPQCGTTLTVGAAGTTVAVPSNVVKSNALQASDAGNIISQSGTTITLGATGDSINLASGATQSGFGRTGTVDWDTTPKTATFSAVSGNGYFCNTTAGAFTVNLPAGSAGAIVSLADYAATWQTNNVTVTPNGTEKIGSLNENATLSTEGQSVTFVYVDSTQGWINTMDSTSNVRGVPPFVTATGGTITESGNCKIHTFTGPGTFTVNNTAICSANNQVSYMIVAGGGGGGGKCAGGGGGAGGFREDKSPVTPYTASPLEGAGTINVTATAFPITVGGGGSPGTAPCIPGTPGANSIFSTKTATGGGGGASFSKNGAPLAGGSGGGDGGRCGELGGSGNTPPVSPPQGRSGGASIPGNSPPAIDSAGGGGGASAVGSNGTSGCAGNGGPGVTSSITGSPVAYSGGGGGGIEDAGGTFGAGSPCGTGGAGGRSSSLSGIAGTTNRGGGGGGAGVVETGTGSGAAGGSGIVIIRYKFQ